MSQEKNRENPQTPEAMMNLGAWLGRHQAFGLIANRCSAADAECLKAIRDGGEYKQLGLTWEQFCVKHAGVSRVHAERQIHCLEEFGGNFFRFAEVMPITPATYRLIAGAVSDEGLECNGERIPLARENRDKVAAAVTAMRARPKPKAGPGAELGSFRKRLDVLLTTAHGIANHPDRRLDLIGLLEAGGQSLQRLALALREKTLVLK
ncbi:MAG: hypothetical protein ABSC05_36660 [Candidatus Solibacter sp.]|jgi:hypothetical protein